MFLSHVDTEFEDLRRRIPLAFRQGLGDGSFLAHLTAHDRFYGREKEEQYMSIRKAFKYRIYPNKETESRLLWVLSRCRELYHAALTERRDAYNFHVRQHPNYYDTETRRRLTSELTVSYNSQQNDLPEIKAELREEFQEIAAHVLQDVLRRLDRAFQAFFRRVRNGETPGYPRFKRRDRYDSFTYPDLAG